MGHNSHHVQIERYGNGATFRDKLNQQQFLYLMQLNAFELSLPVISRQIWK